jgi:hypothetical protein
MSRSLVPAGPSTTQIRADQPLASESDCFTPDDVSGAGVRYDSDPAGPCEGVALNRNPRVGATPFPIGPLRLQTSNSN